MLCQLGQTQSIVCSCIIRHLHCTDLRPLLVASCSTMPHPIRQRYTYLTCMLTLAMQKAPAAARALV